MSQNDRDYESESRQGGGRHVAPTTRRRKKKKKAGKIILIVLLVLLAAVILAAVGLFLHMYGLMDTSALRGNKTNPTATPTAAVETTPAPAFTEEPEPTPTPTPEPLTEEELRELEEMELRTSLQEDAEELIYSDSVYNILLLGADGRSKNLERSDAMILLSINKESKTMWLTSLMRDTQVTIDNWGLAHLNWCTSIGGVDMLIDTIQSEKNFALKIDNWALVDFLDFAEIANMVGPITVSVTAKEAKDMNVRIREVCRIRDRELGLSKEESTTRYYFPAEGGEDIVVTDGIQILGYCRERHVGGDTGRSQKQRDVLMQMWNNVKKMSLSEQYKLAEAVMSIISTNLTRGQCASLLLTAPALLTYDVQAQQCPVIGAMWKGRDHNGLSIYNADFRVNRNFLRATIYAEEMTKADLTSSWSGQTVLVWWPEGKE